jgi:hypothetical protein
MQLVHIRTTFVNWEPAHEDVNYPSDLNVFGRKKPKGLNRIAKTRPYLVVAGKNRMLLAGVLLCY